MQAQLWLKIMMQQSRLGVALGTRHHRAYDEFKGIYFTGMAVSERLAQSGLLDLDKLHQRAMLRLLDIRLEHPHKAFRKDLSDKVRTVITHGKVLEHFGKYGWYLIHKCLYNAANESSKSI